LFESSQIDWQAGSFMTLKSNLLLVLGLVGLFGLMMPSTLLASPSACDLDASNLVYNCGFEMGDFGGWSLNRAASGSDIGVDPVPHTGVYGAEFGAVDGLNDYIYQGLSTTPGDTYAVSFWVNGSGSEGGQFVADWDGTNILTLTGTISGGYTDYTFVETATATSTQLEFGGNAPGYYYLDDVQVDPTPEISSIFLFGTGLAGIFLMLVRSRCAGRRLFRNHC